MIATASLTNNVIQDILNRSYFEEPSSLKDVLVESLRNVMPALSELQANEHLEEEADSYLSALLRKQKEMRDEGLFCPYQVMAETNEIVGYSYPRVSDSDLMAAIRRVAPQVRGALETVRGLSPDDFELFCKRILDILRAKEAFKTQASNDGGIDFFGWLQIPETFLGSGDVPQFEVDLRMLVVGQAKRYALNNPIEVSHIRELVGTVAAFHHDQLAPWPSKYLMPAFALLSPILPLMMTTGRITSGARSLAKKCGVVTRDGAEITLFVCLKGIGMKPVAVGEQTLLEFSSQEFHRWLRA